MWLITFLFSEALLIWCMFLILDAGELIVKTQLHYDPTIGMLVSSGMLLWLSAILFCGLCVWEEFIES